MAIGTDLSVSAAGVIDYIGAAHGATGAGYYTVLELHRWAGGLMDDAQASGNDLLDITSLTASERSTDNIVTLKAPYTITAALSEHLYDGSIIQEVDGTIWDGLVVIAAPNMDLQIQQNGAIVVNDFWNTVVFNDGGINPNGYKGLNRDQPNGISHRFMIKVNAAGTEIDGRRLIGQTRVTGKTYSEFKINGTSRGNNVLALTYADDLNDTTDASARTTIVNVEGYQLLDVDGFGGTEPYHSQWNIAGYTSKQFYERMKWISRVGSATTLFGLNGEVFRGVTHEVGLTTPRSGTFAAFEAVSWGTGGTAGTGQMLAIDSTTAGTKMWIQLLTGVAPSASVTITGASTATATNSGTPTERTVTTPHCGVSTGSALIGSYGFGIETNDLTSSDLLRDLNNSVHQPPNNVTFTVGGVESGEDYILVGPANGTALRVDQFALNTTVTASGATVICKLGTETPGTSTNSATDTPNSGTIRMLGDDGVYHRVTYTGRSQGAGTMTFTGCSGTPAATADNNIFISYVDALYNGTTATDRFTVVYAANRSLFVRVRDGAGTPIKTFETTGVLGSGGGSTTAIRTADA